VSASEAIGEAGRAVGGQPAALLICTPIRLFREGLATVLGGAEGVRVVATAADRSGALAAARACRCTAVLIDIGMPEALPTIRQLTAELPYLRVIALGVSETESAVIACAEAGVAALVTADESLDDLLATVAASVRGEAPCSPRLAGMLLRRVATLAGERRVPERPAVHLTEREREILGLMAEGLSNKQIGQRLWIELPTVKNHVHRILEKLAVSRRAEAVAWLHAHQRV
jgi:two-component system nitrate/nitrite response regulator NarL